MTAPTNLDELLALVPGLRKCRRLNADWLRTLLDRRKGECTWCGATVPKGSRTWCSDACVIEFKLRCDPAAQAQHVAKRDGDVCALCQRVIAEMEREYRVGWEQYKLDHGLASNFGNWKFKLAYDRQVGVNSHSWREVDHIVPVIEGGGLCGPDNLRLLCGTCHAAETRRLRKRLAKK